MTEIDWKTKLLAMKRDLQATDSAAKDSRGAVELDQSRVGRLSRMDALQSQAMNNAIAVRRQQMLSRLNSALERIEVDEFGYCLECGDEISAKRLELDPTVCFCTQCAKA